MKKFIIFALPLLIITLLPIDVSLAQSVPPSKFVTCSGVDCSACDFVSMINVIIVWLFGIVFMIFAVLMLKAGFGLVTSGGSQSALEAAKSSFQNALIGLLIVMAGWLLVDTVMRGLLKGGTGEIEGYGPWSEVKCQVQTKTERYIPSEDSTAAVTGTFGYQAFSHDVQNSCRKGHSASLPNIAACNSALSTLTSSVTAIHVTKKCDDTPVTATVPAWMSDPLCASAASPTADGSFDYQSGVAAQAGHASAALSSMLSCMASKVPGNVGVISSISDNQISSGAKTWLQCRLGGNQCAHTTNSYHYGNTGKCGDKSYAVDFGDENNASVLCAAANSCGTIKSCSVHNGNHVHLDLPVICN